MPNQFHEILVILTTSLSSSIAAPIVQNVTGTVLSSTNIARSKAIWYILKYIGTNYIAHAFTINIAAGYGSFYATIFGFTSLFFPYIGLSTACRSLEQMAILEKDPLKRAARAGALCMVVRTKYWKPRPGDKVWCWQKNDNNGEPKSLYYEGLELEYLSQRYVKIHGHCCLPESTCSPSCANQSSCKENHQKEYMMARVPQDFKVKWTTLSEDAKGFKSNRIGQQKQTDWFKESQCEISSLHSIPKTFLALIQLISAVPTIWQGRNDQRGYAAYQLTLVPYALMSLINILSSFLTPNYPTVYMINSTTMEEAISRGGQFDGTVGELCETDPKKVDNNNTTPPILNFDRDKISFQSEDFSRTKLRELEKLTLPKMLWDAVKYIFKHLIDEHLRREIYIGRVHWRKSGMMTKSNVRRIFRRAPKADRRSHLIMVSPFGCPKFREWKLIDTTMTVVADILLMVSLLVPYIVMGIFSQFRSGRSRWYERALFITWLVLGQILYSYQRLLWGYLQARVAPLGTKWLNGVLALVMIASAIHALAAVGGFVVTGLMIWQDTIHPANATAVLPSSSQIY